MDLDMFCTAATQVCARNFIGCLSAGISGGELLSKLKDLIDSSEIDTSQFMIQRLFNKAENCINYSLSATDIVRQKYKIGPPPLILARMLSIRGLARCEQGKYRDSLEDAECSIQVYENFTQGYLIASYALKGLTDYPRAAYYLMLALAKDLCDNFVVFMTELAVLISEMKTHHKDEFNVFKDMSIRVIDALDVWTHIVKILSDGNKFEALAIITTGECDSCCISSSVVHRVASVAGLTLTFLNVGRMLKFLADKEGTKSWHLKLAIFVVKRKANILTVANYFNKPFLIAMTTLSVEGELPSFLSLAWENLSVEDYDQKDKEGNTAFHALTKHRKFCKPTSEIICRELLANGCLTTEVDNAGKFPHDYIPPAHPIHKKLKITMTVPDDGVKKRLELFRKSGSKAFKELKYDKAIEFYQKAMLLASKFSTLNSEAAILHSNISAAYLSMGEYAQALKYAESCLKADPNFSKGYLRKGLALSKMGNHKSAFEAFKTGFHQSTDPSMKDSFSTSIAKILRHIQDADKMSLSELKEMLNYKWPERVKYLTQNGLWVEVNCLFMGPPYALFVIPTDDFRAGIMALSDASQAVLSTIFQAVDINTFNAPALILKLIEQGASPKSLASSKETTHFHAAVRFSILTNDILVLKYILEQDKENKAQSSIDNEGRTPLHTLCIENDKKRINKWLCLQIATLLGENKVDFNVKDKYQRTAADYDLKSQFKMILESIQHNFLKQPKDAKCQELKEKGNEAFKNAKYEDAYLLYSEAISVLKSEIENPLYESSSKDWRNLAILYGNCAECSHKKGDVEMFLLNAKQSVDADGSWYKGHWRVARAYRENKKLKTAIKAFANAVKTLQADDGVGLENLILPDFVETIYEQVQSYGSGVLESAEKANFLAVLRGTIISWWPQIVCHFLDNNKWDLAEFIFIHCVSIPGNFGNIRLSVFCDKKAEQGRWGLLPLLLHFLKSGADHKTLKFHDRDTYFHATISIIVMSGTFPVSLNRNKPVDNDTTQLLNFVVTQKVIPSNELNIRDNKGNTVLHHLAALKGPDKIREFLANYLLELGVDVTAINYERKLAIDLTSSSDVIRISLQFFLDKMKTIEKLKNQKQESSNSQTSRQQTVPPNSQTSKHQTVPPNSQTNKQQTAPTNSKTSKQQTVPETISKVANPAQIIPPRCNACERRWKMASESPKKDNYQEVITNLVQVVNCKSASMSYHKSMTEQAIERIASLLTNCEQDIPHSVFKLSAKVFKVILTSLAKSKCWTRVEMLVMKFRQNKGQSALPDFAKNMSLIDLVNDQSLDTQSERINLINLLVSGQVNVDTKSLAPALGSYMNKSEWQMVIKLLELGADPLAMTLSAGDTPYHAALQVALNKQPGDFSLLEKLKQLEDSQATAQTHSGMSCQDIDGNTILHIAAQAKFNPHSLRAVELLCQWNVSADIRNNENKLAIQCLPSDKDRRAQYLKSSAVGSTMPASSKMSKRKAAGSKEGVSDGASRTSTWTSVQRIEMEDILLALPVASYNYLNYDTKAKKKVEVVDSIDSNDSEGEKESDGETEPNMKATAVGLEAELSAEDLDIDIKAFDAPVWDIECTEDVWSVLRSRNEQSQGKKLGKKTMPHKLKQIIVKRVQQLSSGDWESSNWQQQISDTPDTLQLFKIALPLGAYILWELAIAFSPRVSESPETVLSVQQEDTAKFSVARGSKIYSEVIRLWSIVLKQSELQHVVRKIVESHERGKSCIIQKSLEAHLYSNKTTSSKHIPNLYVEIDFDQTQKAETMADNQRHLFPPASAHKNEYHVLKFYSFSSSLVSAALNNSDKNVDFPFRVTDMEHAFIHLKSESPLLLLGRSGTGKTTCCLYRMWNMFLVYWQKAIICGTPMLQRRIYFPEIAEDGGEFQENEIIKQAKGATNSTVEEAAVNQNGDRRDSQNEDSQQNDADSEDGEQDSDFHYDHLHQLFVTKNPVLCLEVQKNFTKLYNGTEEMQSNNVWQNTDLPNTFQDMGEFSFPLFVTSRQLLLILDASLDGNPFFPRDEDLALKVTIPGWGAQEDIFNIIPLEHDDLFDSSDDDDGDAVKGTSANRARRVKHVHNMGERPERKEFNKRECTHDVFSYEVWPKVNKKLKIDCHPSLVWTEILSFIKGSYEALQTERGYLDKTQYINVGRKRAPNFTGDRSKVYDAFIEYQKYKKMYALFDEADLVFVLYRRLRAMPFKSWILHEIYVDETQDFTQAELALLVSLCSDPNKMFLTGDTAQSIMRGISFRFDDLLSMFFCIKESASKSEQHLSTLKRPQKVHQLRHNYRSHTGILSLAASVLDILLELFKDSFDRLKRDQGMFAGPKPIIIESSSPEDLALLLTGSRRKTAHIEFGAHQAILVVNEEAKAKLPEELGAGIVLTIFESKGLEFDDILLYNFFKDSQAKKEWRVVTNFLNTFDEIEATDNSQQGLVEIDAETFKCRPLAFDSNHHKVLNSELKHLYTAITRARVNVWIFDEDEEKRAPMFEYFRARGLVTCMGSSECANVNDAIMFADKSTAKEWKIAGDKYMLQQLYSLAAKCYGLAEQPNNVKVALAYQTALEASRLRSTPKAMKDKYFKAGAQFVECGDLHRAAMCFQNSQDFLLSAIAFERNGKFEEASNLYMRAQRANDACNCLEQIGMFGRAIRLLVDNELFDRAIDCLKRYEMEIQKAKREVGVVPSVLIENKPSDVHSEANLCYRSANSHYSKGRNAEAIAAIKRLRNLDDQIQFLREHGFLEEAANILGQAGKTKEAAQYMLWSGNTDQALEYAQEGFHKELRALIHLTIARRHESSDNSLEKIQANATKALHIYTELDDYNGQAQAKLLLGKHQADLKLLSSASKDFRKLKTPNQAGELECSIVIAQATCGIDNVKFYNEVSKIITLGRNVLDVLLNKKAEDSAKYQLYMSFYGMEVDPLKHQVTWYPNLSQPCKMFLKISVSEEAKKFETLDEANAVSAFEEYLMSRIEKMYHQAQKWLEGQISSILPCLRMQEGQSCTGDCPFMHAPFKSTQEEINALNMIVLSVNLDFSMHSHIEQLVAKRLQKPDMERTVLERSRWKSVERLLEFVLPAYPSTQRGQHYHTQEIVKTLRGNKNVKTQVERYLLYLWNNPGRVGKGLSSDVLKERCKSTKWIVDACFFASLLNLQLDVDAEVKKLEKELMSKAVRWAHKRDKYALFIKRSQKDNSLLIEAMGTRFIQSFHWLTKEKDPSEAIFPFTRMVSAFGVRFELSLMPRLDHFVFWIEFYVTLSWLLMAKANRKGDIKESFYMTNSYLFNLHIVGVCTSNDWTIPQLVQQMKMKHSSHLISSRLQFMVNFLVGHNEFSDLGLISQVSNLCEETPVRFCLAERILVLSALLLLNIPGQYVSPENEVPIRRELCKLKINELMPQRLASFINSLKNSANYGDVAAALFNYFHQQGSDRLIFCQLSIKQKQQPFLFIETQLSESPSLAFYEVDMQAEIDKTSRNKSSQNLQSEAADTTDAEFDSADIERKEAQKAQIEEETKQRNAVKKIIRLLRLNVMYRRLARKAYRTIEIDDLFEQYVLKKTSCGICGVDIESIMPGLSEDDKVQQFNQIHRQQQDHIENLHSFMSFKAAYTKQIYPTYQEIMRFLSENKVESPQIYEIIGLDITKVLKAKDEFESTLRENLNSRKWASKETVLKAFTTFEETFNEHRQKIVDVYNDHKKATKEHNNQTGRQPKEHKEESLMDVHYDASKTPNDTSTDWQFKKNKTRHNRSKN